MISISKDAPKPISKFLLKLLFIAVVRLLSTCLTTDRKDKCECRTLTDLAVRRYYSVVFFNNFLNDSQSDARSFKGMAVIEALKNLENALIEINAKRNEK